MTPDPSAPLRFGEYLLTAELGRDALGQVYRALRVAGERGFVRLRILESPEISEDAVLDAIEGNGEIHSFLKNPTIARGVQMDSVEGTPYIAWEEPGGRTLDSLLTKSRRLGQRIPFDHALLIAEKIATALDYAYNTTVDAERTLHGLAWPGFVSISDEGETRLVGFGLAPGFFSSLSKPRFAREIAPYIAPEERNEERVTGNSDVYSVGVLLFELLTGRLPAVDTVAELRGARASHPIPPEAAAVLAKCLMPTESRYPSSGDLRRELGKLLFTGSASPSTFNLAFFLGNLFASEIEAEKKARARELTLDPATARPRPLPPAGPPAPAVPRPSSAPHSPAAPRVSKKRSWGPLAAGGVVLLTAAVIGVLLLVLRGSSPGRQPAQPSPAPTPAAARPPEARAAPTLPPTTGMSEAEFRREVSRRVAEELSAFARQIEPTPAAGPEQSPALREPAKPPAEPPKSETVAAASPQIEPTPSTAAAARSLIPEAPREATPSATPPAESPTEVVETPPRILRIVKPTYPPIALQARVGGIVVLRVLVSETGSPLDIQVLRAATGGLNEAAVAAVRKWTFEPARRNGVAVQAWTTIPIPFQP